jgi:hypothetical protein
MAIRINDAEFSGGVRRRYLRLSPPSSAGCNKLPEGPDGTAWYGKQRPAGAKLKKQWLRSLSKNTSIKYAEEHVYCIIDCCSS